MLQIRNLSKQFSGTYCLTDVSFDLRAGEVHGLIGENGAGKSTLVNILSGALPATSGEVAMDGRVRAFSAPHDALRAGIAHVSQEGSLVPYLTGAENILLGDEPKAAGFFISSRKLEAEAQALAQRTFPHRKLDLRTPVEELSYADQKVIEILRALRSEAKVLILDEPTASLPAEDKKQLSALIRDLAERGTTVVLISHYLHEVLELTDRITVLRDGAHIVTMNTSDATEELLVRHMLARSEGATSTQGSGTRQLGKAGAPRLATHYLTGAAFQDVSLELAPGEVLGLVGLVGAGQIEFAEALYGAQPWLGGQVVLNGAPLTALTPRKALSLGICLIPDQRMLKALQADWSVRENLSLIHLNDVSLGGTPLVAGTTERRLSREVVKRLQIKASSLEQPIQELSGGNKQKVSIGRWLFESTGKDYQVVVFVEPSEGVDVGVKAEIHGLIRAMANDGISVIIVSSDLLEVVSLADRVGVFRAGRLTSVTDVPNEDALISAMAGGN
ncbi:MAG: sugar ABC transporter ATP-binding protein [Trueperaceae bacterium]